MNDTTGVSTLKDQVRPIDSVMTTEPLPQREPGKQAPKTGGEKHPIEWGS